MASNNGITTNLNQYPYFSDFDANSKYYNILFKPSTAVQTRELNNLQQSFQHQINLFGSNIFTEGTIVSGCNISLNNKTAYVKINDTYSNGSAFTITDFQDLYAQSPTTGLRAHI